MNLNNKLKAEINNMQYSEMLHKWRFAPAGDKLFQGESGDYFSKNMSEKRNKLSEDEKINISKCIGW
jgi:hypothetical protein